MIEELNRLREKHLNESKATASVTSGVAWNLSTQSKSIKELDAYQSLLP